MIIIVFIIIHLECASKLAAAEYDWPKGAKPLALRNQWQPHTFTISCVWVYIYIYIYGEREKYIKL